MSDATFTSILHQALQEVRLGRFEAARELLRKATQTERPRDRLDALLRLGKLCVQGGTACYAEAETRLAEARLLAEQIGSMRQAAVAGNLLALLLLHQHRHDEAQRQLENCPALKQTGAPGPEMGQWYHYRGLLHGAQGNLLDAKRSSFRAYQLYQEAHYTAGLAEVCDSLANLLLKDGKTRPALRFADKSLVLKRELGDRFGEAISWGTKGRIFLQLADYDAARQAFDTDLAIARELGDDRGVGHMLNNLGETALARKEPAAAAAHFCDNLAGKRGAFNDFFALAGLTRAYLASGELDQAESACTQLAELHAAQPTFAGLSHWLTGLRGALAGRRGDFASGVMLLQQAIDGLKRMDESLASFPFLYELRDLYQAQGTLDRAVAVMADALDLWGECGSERGVADVEAWLRTVDRPSLVRLALERHLPPPLVQDVLDGKLVPREPRKQRLTVLFTDLRDYTTLAEKMEPGELVELLNDWFSEATRAVRRHDGLVDKFIGDAVMALFGVPDERPDAAADAVRAALDMREALAALNLRQQVLGGPTLRIGVGVDTGEAVVGFLGSHLRRSYTAIGDVVNTASRLEGMSKQHNCDIVISQAVQDEQEVFGVAETTFLGKVTVKGRVQEVAVYRVDGLRAGEL